MNSTPSAARLLLAIPDVGEGGIGAEEPPQAVALAEYLLRRSAEGLHIRSIGALLSRLPGLLILRPNRVVEALIKRQDLILAGEREQRAIYERELFTDR